MLRNLQSLYDHGRLGGTGYVSILPVDQGIEQAIRMSRDLSLVTANRS